MFLPCQPFFFSCPCPIVNVRHPFKQPKFFLNKILVNFFIVFFITSNPFCFRPLIFDKPYHMQMLGHASLLSSYFGIAKYLTKVEHTTHQKAKSSRATSFSFFTFQLDDTIISSISTNKLFLCICHFLLPPSIYNGFHNPHQQSCPLTQLKHSANFGCNKGLIRENFLKIEPVLILPCFLDAWIEITTSIIIRFLWLKLRKLVYCKW